MRYDSSFFLRIGLAFVFIYAAISGFLNPQAWIGFIPGFIENFISRDVFLVLHEIVNLGLGIWLVSGKKTFYAASIAALSFAGITLVNLSSFLITFRDVGLFFAAIALAVMSKKK